MRRLLICLTCLVPSLLAQEPRREGAVPFTVRERIAAGAWLRVHNSNGPVDALEVSGETAEVQGEWTLRSRERDGVRYELFRDGQDVVLCVLPDDRGMCRRDGISSGSGRGRDPGSVAVTVRVPRGVRLLVRSGNGAVRVSGITAEVDAASGNGDVTVDRSGGPVRAHSGNGDVDVTTARGPVNAHTGNGRIWARMREIEGSEDMEFHSGNGRVTVELPEGVEGLLEAWTGNGHIESDFPITVEGRFSVSRLSGTIGSGRSQRRIKLWSGNGNLELRRFAP